ILLNPWCTPTGLPSRAGRYDNPRKNATSRKPSQIGASMSLSLVEALGQVELKPGRVYRCQVNGRWVELRVLEADQVRRVARYDESDLMLDPWVELPQPTPLFSVAGEFGPTPVADVPEIPADWEDA